jgi:magnesium-transporting ATPase (P-type)
VVYFLFGTNGAEVLTILLALAFDWPLPLIAAQILWLNLVTDSFQVMALAFEPGEPDVMARPPRGRQAGILSRLLWERVGLASVVMTAGMLALFRWELDRTGSEQTAQTAALTTMVLFQMFQAANARSERRSLFRLNPFGNPLLFLAIVASIAIHAVALYLGPTQYLLRVEPLDLWTWGRAALVAGSVVVVSELHKWLRASERGAVSLASDTNVGVRVMDRRDQDQP